MYLLSRSCLPAYQHLMWSQHLQGYIISSQFLFIQQVFGICTNVKCDVSSLFEECTCIKFLDSIVTSSCNCQSCVYVISLYVTVSE